MYPCLPAIKDEIMDTGHVIPATSKRGRTGSYPNEDHGSKHANPNGHNRRLSVQQLLPHHLAPLAADQRGLRVRAKRR